MIRLLNQSDKEMVLDYLERNHIETTFLIGNVLEFGLDNNRDIRRCGDYYGYFEGEDLKGVIPFYNLGSCIPHFESEKAVEGFSELINTRNIDVLIGMKKVIAPIYEVIKDFKKTIDYSECSYFINEDFKPFSLKNIELRGAGEIDESTALEYIVEAYKDGFNHEITKDEARKSLNQRGKEEDFIFAVKDGHIVAQANIQTFTSKINQIGGVYTSQVHRGKGYCKWIVSELCKKILERGKVPTLSVRNDNTSAVKAYQAIGFEFYDDYLIIKF